jgi:hypothetical protein
MKMMLGGALRYERLGATRTAASDEAPAEERPTPACVAWNAVTACATGERNHGLHGRGTQ